MQQKNLLILSFVTVGALALAALALRGNDSGAPMGAQGLLFPELSESINDVTELSVEKAGKSVTLRREDGQWRLVDRGGYPAEFTKVKELAMRVASLEIEEKKTAKKANHATLGVEWPSTADEDGEAAEAGLVTLKDGGGKVLASMVIGKSEWRGSSPKVFVRLADEDQVYLCSPRGSLDASPDAKSWIEPKFLELENERVQAVTIEHADGEKITIGRSAANHTQFALQNLPPGMNEKYAGVANGVAQALGYGLSLEDVRPAAEVDFAAEPVAKTRFRCADGLELLLELAKFEDKTWIKVGASFTPPPEPPEPAESEDEGVEDSAEVAAPGEPEKDVAGEATALNERLAPWAFEVGSYKTDALARRLKDLIAEPASEADDGLQGAMEALGLDESDFEEQAPGDEEATEAMEPEPSEDDEGESIPASDEGEPE